MEEPLQAGLARFISGCSLEKIPEKFKADARLRILDWAGCAIAGAHYPQTVIAGRYLSSVGGAAESTAIGLDDRLPARSAAFLNGVAGHVCELDDGHRTAIGHPGSVTIPVALALAEKTGATGADFLKAVIIGYDTFARLGRTVNPSHYKTWHTTGTVGTVAAAATAASILGLNEEAANNAIGLAATMAGGLIESFGSHAKALNIAEACQNGIDAALLAQSGFTGSHSALLGKKGFVAATCSDPHPENLENPSEETLVSDTAFFKVYASCGHTNSPLDALFSLMKKHPLDPDTIRSVRVKTYRVAVDVTGAFRYGTEDEAKFSLPWCFAAAITDGAVTLSQFTPEARADERKLALARKVEVTEDPEATSLFPRRVAEVEVTLSDGTVLSDKVWNSNDAADPAVIRQKFVSAVQKTLGDEGAEKAADLLLAADSLSGVSPIAQLISVA